MNAPTRAHKLLNQTMTSTKSTIMTTLRTISITAKETTTTTWEVAEAMRVEVRLILTVYLFFGSFECRRRLWLRRGMKIYLFTPHCITTNAIILLHKAMLGSLGNIWNPIFSLRWTMVLEASRTVLHRHILWTLKLLWIVLYTFSTEFSTYRFSRAAIVIRNLPWSRVKMPARVERCLTNKGCRSFGLFKISSSKKYKHALTWPSFLEWWLVWYY